MDDIGHICIDAQRFCQQIIHANINLCDTINCIEKKSRYLTIDNLKEMWVFVKVYWFGGTYDIKPFMETNNSEMDFLIADAREYEKKVDRNIERIEESIKKISSAAHEREELYAEGSIMRKQRQKDEMTEELNKILSGYNVDYAERQLRCSEFSAIYEKVHGIEEE